jgi:hypothetical protein
MSDAEAVQAAEFVASGTEGAPPAPAEGGGGKPDELFDGLVESLGVTVDQNRPAEEEAKPEAEAKKPEAEEDEAEPEFDDLSDDKPWTPERIKNAAAQTKADRRKVGAMLSQLSAREKKLKGKVEQVRTEKRQIDLITTRVMGDIQAMREGTPDQALAALGRLAQRDPHSMYEGISLAMLGKAAPTKEAAELSAVRAELAELKNELKTGRQQQTEQQATDHAQRQVMTVLQSADEWPIIAERASANPEGVAQEFWNIYVAECRAAGQRLDVATVADRIERKLRLQSKPSHQVKQNGAAGSGPGREQETRATANPEQAQSPPRSLSPSQAAVAGASRRTTTEEELKDELVRSGPEDPFFKQFGIQMTGF